MKVLYYGNFSSDSTETKIKNALDRIDGIKIITVEESAGFAELETECSMARPDVLLFAKLKDKDDWKIGPKGICETVDVLKAIRPHVGKLACWVFDLLAPAYRTERFQWAVAVSEVCDLFCTTDGFTAPFLFNSRVLRQGVAVETVRPGKVDPRYACDALFLGGAYGERVPWVNELHKRLLRRFWHVPEGLTGDALNDVMASCGLCLGPLWPTYPGYWSNRIYEVAGHGGVFFGPMVAAMEDEGWKDGQNMLVAACDDEYADDIITILDDMRDRLEDIGEQSQEFVLNNHTYDHRAKTLVSWLEE